jgi:uncharacterized protein (TIGR03435 family)
MKRLLGAGLALAIAVPSPAAAQADAVPVFDAISIKVQEGNPSFVPSSPGRFADVNATLESLITWAWDVRDFQVEGGPEWAASRRFDVTARSPRPVSETTMRLMVRQLLADRFQLRTRVERREMRRYILRRARADGRLGPGLQRADTNCAEVLAARFGAPAPRGSSEPVCAWRVGIAAPLAQMIVDGAPMPGFAGLLERLLGRKVVDGTGLEGFYNVRLEFSSDQLPMAAPPALDSAATPRDGLSIFTALQDQLGLRLDSEQGPVDVVVIESAELPSPN